MRGLCVGSLCLAGSLLAAGASEGGPSDGLAAMSADTPFDSLHARPTLLCETTELRPGTTAWLAVAFDIDDHWHLYWNGRNDSGLPPEIEPRLPAGYEMGEIVWPAPERLVSPGDIVDHVYSHELLLLFPVTVPRSAAPGVFAELSFDVSWLVCHEMCIPESRALTLRLPVGAGIGEPPPSQHAKRFAATREALPRPLREAGNRVRARWDDGWLELRAKGWKAVAFYPDTASVGLAQPLAWSVTGSETLRLLPEAGGRVSGVLAASDGKGGRFAYFLVDVPTPGSR